MVPKGRVWLAEKPSFAKELGKALGNCQSIERYAWQTNGGVIVAAAGHLVELAEPHDYREEWREWKAESLPMVPDNWDFKYRPIKGKEAQLSIIGKYLSQATEIIVATDAGREGEYIAWSILQYLGVNGKNKKRLWSSGANVQSITKAAQESALLNYAKKFNLAQAARIRAESDWVEGLNLTRLITTRFRPKGMRGPVSVGRVQTATLALIVARQREIEGFVSEKYYDLMLDVMTATTTIRLYHKPSEAKRIKDAGLARSIVQSADQKSVALDVKDEDKKQGPPALFESSSLQIRAYNLWGWEASKTEEISQSLYDRHKLISYPRTDGIHLEDEQWNDVGPIIENIKSMRIAKSTIIKGREYFPDMASIVPEFNNISPRDTVFNSKLLEKSGADHHGIIPTTDPANFDELTPDEIKLYLLIVRQFMAQILPDCEYSQKTISLMHEERKFSTTGRVIHRPGWKVLFGEADENAGATERGITEKEEQNEDLPHIMDKTRARVNKTYVVEKNTVAPPQFTEGSIISAMRDLRKVIKDPEQLEKVKIASILGTKSTWGDTIKKLKERMYITSNKGKLVPSVLGYDLYDLCAKHAPTLIDPTSTASLEYMLMDVEKGKCDTTKAREILQGRNIDAIRRCVNIESANLRVPEGMKEKNANYNNAPFKDFEQGSYVLDVPFDDKDAVKQLGGRFNGETKKWHLPKDKATEEELIAKKWLK